MPFCFFLVASRIFRWRHGLTHFSRYSRSRYQVRPHRRRDTHSTFWLTNCCVTCGFAQSRRFAAGAAGAPAAMPRGEAGRAARRAVSSAAV